MMTGAAPGTRASRPTQFALYAPLANADTCHADGAARPYGAPDADERGEPVVHPGRDDLRVGAPAGRQAPAGGGRGPRASRSSAGSSTRRTGADAPPTTCGLLVRRHARGRLVLRRRARRTRSPDTPLSDAIVMDEVLRTDRSGGPGAEPDAAPGLHVREPAAGGQRRARVRPRPDLRPGRRACRRRDRAPRHDPAGARRVAADDADPRLGPFNGHLAEQGQRHRRPHGRRDAPRRTSSPSRTGASTSSTSPVAARSESGTCSSRRCATRCLPRRAWQMRFTGARTLAMAGVATPRPARRTAGALASGWGI